MPAGAEARLNRIERIEEVRPARRAARARRESARFALPAGIRALLCCDLLGGHAVEEIIARIE